MNRLVFFLIGFAVCLPANAQETVKIVLTVIEVYQAAERPAVNKEITIIPKNQGASFGRTDSNGQIAFTFPSTQSVTFHVGEVGNSVRLQPLSGRTNQNTSFLINNITTTTKNHTVSVPVDHAVDRDIIWEKAQGFSQLIEDLKTLAGGRLMNQQSRNYLLSIKPAIEKVMTPDSTASEFLRTGLASAQRQLLAEVDDILAPAFRLGAEVEDTQLGVRVDGVQPGGPADAAGIKPGDIITHFGFSRVAGSGQSFRWMVANAVQAESKLTIKRGNGTLDVNVLLTK